MQGVESFDVGVDYDAAEEVTPFAQLPPGPRTVTVLEVADGGQSTAGNKKYNYKLKILNLPAEKPPVGAAGEARKWRDTLTLRMNSSPKTDFMWKTLFKACGVKWTGKSINPNLIVGKKLIVDVVLQEYPKGSGQMRNDIQGGGFHPAKV